MEAARVFAQRVLEDGGDTFEEQLRFAFLLAVARSPDPNETKTLKSLYTESKKSFSDNDKDAEKLLGVGLSKQKPANRIELAAWTQVARAILNFDETITRN